MENDTFWKEYRRTYVDGIKGNRFKLKVKKLEFPFSQKAYLVLDYYPKITFDEKKCLGFFEEIDAMKGEGNLYLVNDTIENKIDEILKDKEKFSYIAPFYNTISKDELRPRYRIGIYFHELGHVGQSCEKYDWIKDDLYRKYSKIILYELRADFRKGPGKPVSYIDYLIKTSKDEAKKTSSVFLASEVKEFGFDIEEPEEDDDYIFMCIL
ncbi:hypothetical protein DRQ09_09565, partial [candidate division KSB1 bacterium]